MDQTFEPYLWVTALLLGAAAAFPCIRFLVRIGTLDAAARLSRDLESRLQVGHLGLHLRRGLEEYKRARTRKDLGGGNTLHAAAAALLREYRLERMERR